MGKSRSPFTSLLDIQQTYQVFVFAPHVWLLWLYFIRQFKIMTGKRGERYNATGWNYGWVSLKRFWYRYWSRYLDFDNHSWTIYAVISAIPECNLVFLHAWIQHITSTIRSQYNNISLCIKILFWMTRNILLLCSIGSAILSVPWNYWQLMPRPSWNQIHASAGQFWKGDMMMWWCIAQLPCQQPCPISEMTR